MLILDTDHVGELQKGTSPAAIRLRDRLVGSDDEVATTIISAEEQMRGWLAKINSEREPGRQVGWYGRLHRLFAFFAAWTVLQWDEGAVASFDRLKAGGVRIGTMDLKIASIVQANGAVLLSRNLRDFEKVPDLRVEDWLSQ